MRTYTTGELSLPDRFYLLAFNSLALGFQLVTPPSPMPSERAVELNDRFAERAQALGFSLPDARLTPHQGWSEFDSARRAATATMATTLASAQPSC